MSEFCKSSVEAAGLGAPAASVMVVAIMAATVIAIIIYLNPPTSPRVIEGRSVATMGDDE